MNKNKSRSWMALITAALLLLREPLHWCKILVIWGEFVSPNRFGDEHSHFPSPETPKSAW